MVAPGRARRAAVPHAAQNAMLPRRSRSRPGFRIGCPRAAIHGDLFRDNVLFPDDTRRRHHRFRLRRDRFPRLRPRDRRQRLVRRRRRRARRRRTQRVRARLRRGAAAGDRRARAVAGAAARGRAALLALAALRPPPAAAGRTRPRARPGALRARPARIATMPRLPGLSFAMSTPPGARATSSSRGTARAGARAGSRARSRCSRARSAGS